MAELKFGDMVVIDTFLKAVFVFWGEVEDEDGEPEYVLTILRKEDPWEPKIYAVGTTHRWPGDWALRKVESWPE